MWLRDTSRELNADDFGNVYAEKVHSFCQYLHQHREDQNIGLLFSFDGASRGNPGAASHGNRGWWGEWSPNQVCQKGLLYEKLSRIHISQPTRLLDSSYAVVPL